MSEIPRKSIENIRLERIPFIPAGVEAKKEPFHALNPCATVEQD
jgi:hypothetical protein